MEINGLLKKDISKIVTFKQFVTSDQVVILEEISSNIQKSHPVIKAYNNKEKNFMLI